jgi:hypothetical protein
MLAVLKLAYLAFGRLDTMAKLNFAIFKTGEIGVDSSN